MVMWQDLNGGRCSMADACSNPSDAEGVQKMLMKNFDRHFTSNRYSYLIQTLCYDRSFKIVFIFLCTPLILAFYCFVVRRFFNPDIYKM